MHLSTCTREAQAVSDEKRHDNEALLRATAMLVEASQSDERIAPLASQAIKIVIDSGEALSLLFASYLQSMQPTSYATQLQQPPGAAQKKQNDLLKNLEQFLKAQS